MLKGPALLIKILTISGAGGGPIIFYGFPSTDTEGQRQFKWLFNWDFSKETEKSINKGSGEGVWVLNKNSFQGVGVDKWKELSKTQSRSVYKLVFKKEWEQKESEVTNSKLAKGAVSLVKVSWGQDGGGRSLQTERAEEVKTEDSNKVWLIIAKGEKSIYLIPVVRTSNWNGWVGDDWWERGKKEIEEKGVPNIDEWVRNFDERKGRDICWNRKLKEKANISGFTIERTVEAVVYGEEIVEIKSEGERNRMKKSLEEDREEMFVEGGRVKGYMHRNAGSLKFGENGDKEMECNKNEKYFLLDISILGDASKLRDGSDSLEDGKQKLKVNDTITQVIRTIQNNFFIWARKTKYFLVFYKEISYPLLRGKDNLSDL